MNTGNPDLLAQRIMPHFFKHCNYQSFVRQLNNYGFHKLDSRQGEVFSNRFFVKDRPDLLCQIKRRVHPSVTKQQQQQQQQTKTTKLDTSSVSSGDESTEPSSQPDSSSQPQNPALPSTLSLSAMNVPLSLTASFTNTTATQFQQKLTGTTISSPTLASSTIASSTFADRRESPDIAALTQRVATLEAHVSELQQVLSVVCTTLQSITGKSVLIPSPRSTLPFQHPILPTTATTTLPPPFQSQSSPQATASLPPSTPSAISASKPSTSPDHTSPPCFKVPALVGSSVVTLPPLSSHNIK